GSADQVDSAVGGGKEAEVGIATGVRIVAEENDVVPPVMTEVVVTSHAVDIPLVPEMGVKVTSLVRASLFQDSNSTETVKADTASPSYFARQDLSM
nr:hypothetical protein [Tanacetum cinerariifolium]